MSTQRQQQNNNKGGRVGKEGTTTESQQPKANTTNTATSSYQPPQKKHNITMLKYDNKAYANFAKFEKDLEEHVGYEFGDLFSFAKTGNYPYEPVPVPRTIATLIEQEKDAVPSTLSVALKIELI